MTPLREKAERLSELLALDGIVCTTHECEHLLVAYELELLREKMLELK